MLSVFKRTEIQGDICQPSLWDEWVDELDCYWQEEDKQWWYSGKIGNARNTREWDEWNSGLTSQMEASFDEYEQAYYYDNKHQKVCTPDGQVGAYKVTADTIVSSCDNPTNTSYTFSEARHRDAKVSNQMQAINFATIYNDKCRQSSSDAQAHGHPEWMYGDFINYDHLPAKSTYKSDCKGGSSGEKLPTVAIQAIDHKGPVWSYCTTSRSLSSDNDRKTVRKMTDYIEANKYGNAIFENLACLLAGALDMNLLTTFTDYITGFKNLMYLHYEANTINQNELDLLLSYLTSAEKSPANARRDEAIFVQLLEDVDTYQEPAWC